MDAPRELYHTSDFTNRESIREHGLKREFSHHYDPDDPDLGGIYFTDKLPDLSGPFDVWVINVQGLDLEIDHDDHDVSEHGNWFVLYGADVTPDRLALFNP